MPGEALLALLQRVGFQQVKLAGYTGMKSSPCTEGALLLAEKQGVDLSREAASSIRESAVTCPEPSPLSQPGGS
jgi:protein-tyrosine-phosphatase